MSIKKGNSVSPATAPREEQAWRSENDTLTQQYNVVSRQRSIPLVNVPLKLEEGKPSERDKLPQITIAEGVTARIAWNHGAVLEVVQMEKGATYPEETLGEELITIVQDGFATCTLGDKRVKLDKDAVLYLTPGMKRNLVAGPDGWKAFEVYSPVRVAHLNMAGVELSANADVSFPDQGVQPLLEAGRVYNLNEIQFTPITDPDPSRSDRRSSANSRLIWGKNAQISFVRMDPNSVFRMHAHPEEQLVLTVRGRLTQGILTKTYEFNGEAGNVVLLPEGMVHSAKMSELGADQLDVFWPVRPDYVEKARKQTALISQVGAIDTEPT